LCFPAMTDLGKAPGLSAHRGLPQSPVPEKIRLFAITDAGKGCAI